jgi:hypothetical protein
MIPWHRSHRDTPLEEIPDYTPAIYGSLLVTTLTVVQWHGNNSAELIALSLVISVVVFWLTHVWSAVVNRRVHRGAGPSYREIATTEATMLTAAILPALVLTLPRLTGMDPDTAIGAAILISLAQLFLWGLAVGRVAHEGWPMTLAVASVDCAFGILIVVLKVIVLH